MDVLCVDCKTLMSGATRQRRRCDACKRTRIRSYLKPIRVLRADEEPPTGVPRRYISGQGYVRLRWKTNDGYVEAYEHRVIAGAKRGEHVHHINGDRTDNDPGNLRVLTAEEHLREHAERGSGEKSSRRSKRIDGDQAERLYRSGLGTEIIAKKLGANPSAVWRLLKRRGVPIRPGKGGGPRRKPRPS